MPSTNPSLLELPTGRRPHRRRPGRRATCGLINRGITLTGRSLTMQVTSKGQVTIPQEIRSQLGLLPHTEVEFELAGDHARIRKARRQPGESVRGRLALELLRGTAKTRMSTDEILALTRGATCAARRRK
ncbi:MAG: AbrB/MazE/SpoVT family DNA-binding domain-containing protein [Acidobacteria bacterium]|nr:AbrB/MazE/SpoVT family DNA-binding domain-containing protein [Acidobacteriota bacterium]